MSLKSAQPAEQSVTGVSELTEEAKALQTQLCAVQQKMLDAKGAERKALRTDADAIDSRLASKTRALREVRGGQDDDSSGVTRPALAADGSAEAKSTPAVRGSEGAGKRAVVVETTPHQPTAAGEVWQCERQCGFMHHK